MPQEGPKIRPINRNGLKWRYGGPRSFGSAIGRSCGFPMGLSNACQLSKYCHSVIRSMARKNRRRLSSIDCGQSFPSFNTDGHKHYERQRQSDSKSSVCSTTRRSRGRNCVACGSALFFNRLKPSFSIFINALPIRMQSQWFQRCFGSLPCGK